MLGLLRTGIEIFAPAGRRLAWLWVVAIALVVAAMEYVTAVLVFGVLDHALEGGAGEISLSLPIPDVGGTALLVTAGIAFLVREILGVLSVYVTESVVQSSSSDVSARLHRRYLYAPYRFHLTRDTSELVRTTVLSVDKAAGEVVRPIITLITQIPIVLTLLVLLVVISPVLSLGALVAVSIFLVVVMRIVQPMLRRLGTLSEKISKSILDNLNDSFRSVREIKTYGSEAYFDRTFAENRSTDARLRVERYTIAAIPSRALEFIVLAGLLTLVGFATSGASFASLIPTLGVFAYATLRVVPSINRIVSSANLMRFGQQALENIAADLEGLDLEPAVSVTSPPTTAPIFNDSIRLRDVVFSYPGDRGLALENVDLEILKGEMLAVVGSSGAGKSTLIDIILGLLDPDDGHRLIDGSPVLPPGWKGAVGVVSQSVIMINGSLRDNVTFGSASPSDEEVERALAAAQLSEWVKDLPAGLDTDLGESGKLVSGGQRQRIAIARSLYRRPQLLILDEATSDLDSETESAVLDNLHKDVDGMTTVVVSHRVAPVEAADRVAFLRAGSVVAVGRYEELVAEEPEVKSLVSR